jgi:protein involved in polysaccharide export with SLBB domain
MKTKQGWKTRGYLATTAVSLLMLLSSCATLNQPKTETNTVAKAQIKEVPQKSSGSVTLPTQEKKTLALGAGDIFEIRVYNEKDISNIYRVSNSGYINFPLLGTVEVNGLTSIQLVSFLQLKLKKYLKNPQVSVFIKEFHSKKVYVFGQVRKPGTFTYEDNMNIIQAITLAGGLQPLADPNGTFVNRVINGAEQKIKVAIKDIGKGEAPNVVLQPGDIVYVPESLF